MNYQYQRKIKEILEEKIELAQETLSDAKPVIVASLKEGILILAINTDLKFNKIYRLHDRIVCAISGRQASIKPIFKLLRISTQNWADFYSEGDIIVGELAEGFAYYMKERFENPLNIAPYAVNVAIAEINPAKKDDMLIQVDFKGDLRDFESYLLLGKTLEESELSQDVKQIEKLSEQGYPVENIKKIEEMLKEGCLINDILSFMTKIDRKIRRTGKGRLEAVFLSREKVLKKEFKDVFQKINFS